MTWAVWLIGKWVAGWFKPTPSALVSAEAPQVAGVASHGNWVVDLVLALCALAAGFLLWYAGHASGYAEARLAAASGQVTELKQAHDDYVAAVADGAKTAKALRDQLAAASSTNSRLEQELKDVPHVIATARCPDPAGVQLTLGAVRLWNSDLSGTDVAANQCGAVGADPTACAAGAGIGLQQAELNARENFRRFQQCVARLDSLQGSLKRPPFISPKEQ